MTFVSLTFEQHYLMAAGFGGHLGSGHVADAGKQVWFGGGHWRIYVAKTLNRIVKLLCQSWAFYLKNSANIGSHKPPKSQLVEYK